MKSKYCKDCPVDVDDPSCAYCKDGSRRPEEVTHVSFFPTFSAKRLVVQGSEDAGYSHEEVPIRIDKKS